ncbi:hypothetical protein HDU98_011433 [Podochytrium sp. JEL0797]|nr:hypothetical protein HDU98_011433 [Podochytrium sp. JEL0797]
MGGEFGMGHLPLNGEYQGAGTAAFNHVQPQQHQPSHQIHQQFQQPQSKQLQHQYNQPYFTESDYQLGFSQQQNQRYSQQYARQHPEQQRQYDPQNAYGKPNFQQQQYLGVQFHVRQNLHPAAQPGMMRQGPQPPNKTNLLPIFGSTAGQGFNQPQSKPSGYPMEQQYPMSSEQQFAYQPQYGHTHRNRGSNAPSHQPHPIYGTRDENPQVKEFQTYESSLKLASAPELPQPLYDFSTFVEDVLLQILQPMRHAGSGFKYDPDFAGYIENVLQTTDVSRSMVLLALKYISMLSSKPGFRYSPGTEKNIIIFGLMLANKILDDHTFTNRTWSEVSKISLVDLNNYEIQFLNLLGHNSFIIPRDEFLNWVTSLQKYYREKKAPSSLVPIQPTRQPSSLRHKQEIMPTQSDRTYLHPPGVDPYPAMRTASLATAADGFIMARSSTGPPPMGQMYSSIPPAQNRNPTFTYTQAPGPPFSESQQIKLENVEDEVVQDHLDSVSDATITALSTPYQKSGGLARTSAADVHPSYQGNLLYPS